MVALTLAERRRYRDDATGSPNVLRQSVEATLHTDVSAGKMLRRARISALTGRNAASMPIVQGLLWAVRVDLAAAQIDDAALHPMTASSPDRPLFQFIKISYMEPCAFSVQ